MSTTPDGWNTPPAYQAIGTDDADNEFASTNVVANADGSTLERLQYLQDELGAAVGASFSADIAAVQTEVDKIGTPAGADVSTDIAAIQTEVDKIGTPVDTDLSTDVANVQSRVGNILRKTVTFNNTADDVTLFTVTGVVKAKLYAVCTTTLESAGGCNLTVLAGTVAVIATTASTDIDANEIWHDATPDAATELASVAPEWLIANGGDIVIDVENAKQVDSGVLEFYLEYVALSSNGAVSVA